MEKLRAKNLTVLFYVSVGASIGLGHWIRSLALWKALLDKKPDLRAVWLVHPDLDKNLEEQLRLKNTELHFLPSKDSEPSLSLIKELDPKLFIFDRLNLSRELVQQANQIGQTLSIGGSGPGLEDLNTRIDGMVPREHHQPHFNGKNYYYGTDYIILRPEFAASEPVLLKDTIESVFISLGSDAAGWGYSLAEAALELNPHFDIRLVMGPLSPPPQLPSDKIQFYQNTQNTYDLMKISDLAITSGGITSSEALSIGVPSIFLPTVEAQNEACRELHKRNAGINLGRWDGNISKLKPQLFQALTKISSKSLRQAFQAEAVKTIDGKGLERTANICLKTIEEET